MARYFARDLLEPALRRRSKLCRMLLLAALSAALPLTVFSPEAAWAQDRATLDQARADFQRALELKHAGDWASALKLFREVSQVKMTPQVRYHIATCEENLGQLVVALGGYELALAQAEGMPEEFQTEVEAAVTSLRARIPKIVIQRGKGAEAANVQLDEVQLGSSKLGTEIPLDPGPHTVMAVAPGFKKSTRTVTLLESATETVIVDLEPLLEGSPVSPSAARSEKAEAAPSGYGIWPYVIGGAGVATIVLGTVLLPVSQGKVGEADELCPDRDCRDVSRSDWDEANQIISDARTLETVGWVAVGAGTLALGTGVVLFLIDPTRKPEEKGVALSDRMAIEFSAQNAPLGLSLHGTY